MTACRIKREETPLYYALHEWKRVSHRTVAPYMFFANVTRIEKKDSESLAAFMPDGNQIFAISCNGLHGFLTEQENPSNNFQKQEAGLI